MVAFGIDVRFGVHKVACPEYADILHRFDSVRIMKSGVDNGNRHALSLESGIVEKVGSAHFNLSDSGPIQAVRTLRIIDQRISFGNCRHFSLPHFLGGTDKRQFGYFIDQHTVIAGDCNEIIPFSGDKHMDAFLSYGIYILLAYRQVGRVDSQLLSQPAVDGFSGKELLRLLDGISGCSLICEADPIFQGIGRGKLSRCSHRCSQDQCR